MNFASAPSAESREIVSLIADYLNHSNCTLVLFLESDQKGSIHRLTSSVKPDVPTSGNSFIFTPKARQEASIPYIIHALQQSVIGRKDKTRAFVEVIHSYQKDGYIDAHYNARVMYDELEKWTPLSFGYHTFRKYYNLQI